MAISIGTVTTVKDPDNWGIAPDDRQSLVQLIDAPYASAIDAGRCPYGDKYKGTITVSAADWATLSGYWINRTPVPVVTPEGESLTDCRFVAKSYSRHSWLLKEYINVMFEIWRV